MGITNQTSGTRIDEIADGIYRISTPIPPTLVPGGFSFNQYLVDDDRPLLFHTGSKRLFPLVSEAIESVMPLKRLTYISFSHYEQDECGSLNDFLKMIPPATPVCGQINAMINSDGMDRSPKILADGESLSLGKRNIKWLDTPHLPHGWECGYVFDEFSKTLFCGDLFTQPGADTKPLTDGDILESSESMRKSMDYFSHTKNASTLFQKLAALQPTTLACMHGSAWRGRGEALLLELGSRLNWRT